MYQSISMLTKISDFRIQHMREMLKKVLYKEPFPLSPTEDIIRTYYRDVEICDDESLVDSLVCSDLVDSKIKTKLCDVRSRFFDMDKIKEEADIPGSWCFDNQYTGRIRDQFISPKRSNRIWIGVPRFGEYQCLQFRHLDGELYSYYTGYSDLIEVCIPTDLIDDYSYEIITPLYAFEPHLICESNNTIIGPLKTFESVRGKRINAYEYTPLTTDMIDQCHVEDLMCLQWKPVLRIQHPMIIVRYLMNYAHLLYYQIR